MEVPLEALLDELGRRVIRVASSCMVMMMVARNLALRTLALKGLYQ